MPPKPSRKRQWQTMLNRRIRELVELAREIDPEAEANVFEPFEEEDAVLELLVTPEKSDEVYEAVLTRSTQIWWDDGFGIVVWVHEKKPEAVKGE
ncbi:hypothetical protein Q2T83_04120 [Fervidibacter sacchari]|uniref:Uncharacterized protein n=1 Tax=Candidatus Fervidibacter sacchari TaxID=1448929 RepID=A0ABT2EP54_9BACT|nr:hypothetical protein [Candidatus Fervidibacter sacchari]MCS3919743.1 hypothetical protein [Candidatus Fervidibacter sacchari]WKU17009.1 hypothetical protein Q2T83_04120 [Candidatus Fervidibacter sacchari]